MQMVNFWPVAAGGDMLLSARSGFPKPRVTFSFLDHLLIVV
jgi:hypothetical protein